MEMAIERWKPYRSKYSAICAVTEEEEEASHGDNEKRRRPGVSNGDGDGNDGSDGGSGDGSERALPYTCKGENNVIIIYEAQTAQ